MQGIPGNPSTSSQAYSPHVPTRAPPLEYLSHQSLCPLGYGQPCMLNSVSESNSVSVNVRDRTVLGTPHLTTLSMGQNVYNVRRVDVTGSDVTGHTVTEGLQGNVITCSQSCAPPP